MKSLPNLLWLIPFLPLASAALLRLLGRQLGRRAVHVLACGSVLGSFVIATLSFLKLAQLPAAERLFRNQLFNWIDCGGFVAGTSFMLDPLSAAMAVMVSGVGFLIHLYSTGYMGHDPQYPRYFSYLNLFTAMMLILILADNLLLMFVGWEGVGLCSYLLIGFWFDKKENADAGKKAFIVNRIGDFGFLLGMLILLVLSGQLLGQASLDFLKLKDLPAAISAAADPRLIPILTVATLALFVGACGKSAQIPLYVWLPDAMAGPTPVSALIHAATMVTSGVYMIGRLGFLYNLTPLSLTVVAVVGCATAVFSASIGLVQNDIKKVLAYSTVSQLGYMFLAMGVGAYAAGIFHLLTHAFFKGLLFLGSGAVIHALHGEQDIRKMGGLRKDLPYTYWTFLAGTLAISGIFPLAGFVSKDEILFQVANKGSILTWVLWGTGLAAAGMTAFYMFRLFFLTFHGSSRLEPETAAKVHESPWSMTLPLVLLAGLSVCGGFLGWPKFLGGGNAIEHWLAQAVHQLEAPENLQGAAEWVLALTSLAVAGAGIATAYFFYLRKPQLPQRLALAWPRCYRILYNKYLVDEFYQATAVRGTLGLSRGLARFDLKVIDGLVDFSAVVTVLVSRLKGAFDNRFVDGAVNGVAAVTQGCGRLVQKIQTGQLQQYLATLALAFFIGAGLWLCGVLWGAF